MVAACGSLRPQCSGVVVHPIDLVKVRMQLWGAKDGFGYGSSHVAGASQRLANRRARALILSLLQLHESMSMLQLHLQLQASLIKNVRAHS